MTEIMMIETTPATDNRRRIRVRAIKSFLRQLLGHSGARLGLFALILFIAMAAMPNLLVGPLQTAMNATGDFLVSPSQVNLLGTDEAGRAVLNLIVHGARTSLVIALVSTLISLIVGTAVGMAAGYYGRWVDSWLMRMTDFFFVIPSFVLALVITPVVLETIGRSGNILGFRPSLFVIILVIGLTSWAFVARIVRSQTLTLRERQFVE
ncbi:ABC transporter permease, partial [Sinorhizobium meliloti]